MTLFWTVIIKAYAFLGMVLSPMFALGALFPARSVAEILFAVGLALLPLPFWRMFLLRRWAGVFICVLSWLLVFYVVAHWREFDVLSAKLVAIAMALVPTLALVFGWSQWRSGF
jgi:hypothetical protein